MTERRTAPETDAAQALGWIDPQTGAVVPPVHTSITYRRESYDTGRVYGRIDHAAYEQVEALLAALERGEDAKVFSAGMAAAATVLQGLERGDHVVAPRQMYYELRGWLQGQGERLGLAVDLLEEITPERVQQALRPGATKLVWIETPSNPFWNVTDIAAVAAVAHAAGARVLVDSTAATPVLTQPLTLGADLVLHSASKYLNGHSDLTAGVLVTLRRDESWRRIGALRQANGAVLGAFEAWLLLRGLRTLYLRVRASCASAQRIAEHLAQHPAVTRVRYPGLPSHPGHATARRQMQDGYGGMLSFHVAGGVEAAVAVSAATRVFHRATSLGSVESLIEHRASVEGAESDVPRDLLRLSVGIEHTQDLIDDLDRALTNS